MAVLMNEKSNTTHYSASPSGSPSTTPTAAAAAASAAASISPTDHKHKQKLVKHSYGTYGTINVMRRDGRPDGRPDGKADKHDQPDKQQRYPLIHQNHRNHQNHKPARKSGLMPPIFCSPFSRKLCLSGAECQFLHVLGVSELKTGYWSDTLSQMSTDQIKDIYGDFCEFRLPRFFLDLPSTRAQIERMLHQSQYPDCHLPHAVDPHYYHHYEPNTIAPLWDYRRGAPPHTASSTSPAATAATAACACFTCVGQLAPFNQSNDVNVSNMSNESDLLLMKQPMKQETENQSPELAESVDQYAQQFAQEQFMFNLITTQTWKFHQPRISRESIESVLIQVAQKWLPPIIAGLA